MSTAVKCATCVNRWATARLIMESQRLFNAMALKLMQVRENDRTLEKKPA